MTGAPWLTILWLGPLVGAGIVLVMPRPELAKWAGLIASSAVVVVTGVIAVQFDALGKQYQFVETHRWIPYFGAGYTVGVDGIALVLVVLTAVLVPILIIAGWNEANHRALVTHTYVALILAVESFVMLSFVALDVLLFYVVFEATLIPLYFLIGRYGSSGSSPAALKFLLYNLFGGLVMLAAIIGLHVSSGTLDFRTLLTLTPDADPAIQRLLFLGFMVAFAIKAPMWPFHTWLPPVAASAKPATAVLMMALVDKVGTFAMLRYCLQLFPDASTYFRPLIITLAVISTIYGAVLAIGQTDVMRLIAYTSISHYGFIILGIFVMTSQGQSGSTLYMVNHGLSTAALFLIAGFLVSRRGTRLISAFGGVQKVAPVLAGTFLVAGLSALALPGLGPFISEFLVLMGTFTRYPAAAVVASAALVLSAVYILWMYQRMMTGPVMDGNEKLRDLLPRELAVVTPLIALLLVLGVYPKPMLDVINPAVSHTMTVLDQIDPTPKVAAK
ncbi:NADH-quinone oxidoreductase subunit M [Mycolicibacterium moriokaense]|uniref:NADH-quinone oxidoreductase subunit M n=1 Tax=Mycolicibacterium moriokaense TaxID=39691 RepID=A0AAD1HBG7_9MYCO|nr:NADH-quinone oxidoreductase subunit M [Mycolicibacterium moriokaense]MCV7041645.1 NADH-quinone oxidoreductase subunit M [Mycolicibacterium moriokaense]ORB21924.1 NADH-quinone oxidoreductase subunit M [Mycolicibacterium moriokaense]BBX01569.1 NADH-quinone oxidoreductase subunit M [Mycolicibacterium moriokaense]